VDSRPVVWDHRNRKHIELDHPERWISTREVEEALEDPQRIEADVERSGRVYSSIVGRTKAGRLLFVVWADDPRGRYPIHARQAGRRLGRSYYR
jgi:hypothetical protein